MDKLRIYLITGWGKGKTTSAIGIAARALANGENVLFCQFLKSGIDSGIKCLSDYSRDFGGEFKFISQNVSGFVRINCTNFWSECLKEIKEFKPALIIFDELNTALDYGLIDDNIDNLFAQLKLISRDSDIYLTGRINNYIIRHQMIEFADVATNCYCEKHHYNHLCPSCSLEFMEDYNYCPSCGEKLVPRILAKKGREY